MLPQAFSTVDAMPLDAPESLPSSPHRDGADAPGTELDPTLEAGRRELVALLDRLTAGVEGTIDTAIPGLALHRIQNPGGPKHGLQVPALGIIAQGSKQILVGDEQIDYDPLHYLVASVDLPTCGRVRVASPTQPYLGLRFELAADRIGELLRDGRVEVPPSADAARGLYVTRLDPLLLDAVLRLLRLLETPRDRDFMAPLVQREILYRLLVSAQGARLRQIALQDSQAQRVAKAIHILRENFQQPLRVHEIARAVHMSESSLHHHFKAVTAMSPLQYQKQLRLQEARRLMLMGGLDVSAAANRVGYESPSQFSREYSRVFGAPPLRDRQRWLAEGAPA